MAISRALLFAAGIVLLVAGVNAAGARHLQQYESQIKVVEGGFARQPVFPYCNCRDYKSTSNPYRYTLIDSGLDPEENAVGEICFVLRYKGAAARPSACYTELEKSLFKLHLSMQPACPPAFDATGRYVTINGVPKTTGIEVIDYPLGSLLKLTALRLNATTADGAKICVRAAYPCHIATNLFTNIPVPISAIESSAHRCCTLTPR